MTRSLVGSLLAVAACAHAPRVNVAVSGDEVMRHVAELQSDRKADLATVITDGAHARPAPNETVFADQDITFRGQRTTLAKVLVDCGSANPTPCAIAPNDVVVLRTAGPQERIVDGTPVIPPPPGSAASTRKTNHALAWICGVVSIGAAGGAVACAIYCGDQKGTKVIGLGATSAVFVLIWALASGTHD